MNTLGQLPRRFGITRLKDCAKPGFQFSLQGFRAFIQCVLCEVSLAPLPGRTLKAGLDGVYKSSMVIRNNQVYPRQASIFRELKNPVQLDSDSLSPIWNPKISLWPSLFIPIANIVL